jgi:alanine-glyoxylate transaminase/serine-glyoxylate transaminase/serine-pyruvate transaminase
VCLGCVGIDIHCGALQLQLLGALAGVELSLRDVGYPVTLGSGVAAAQTHLLRATPLITSRI